MELLTEQQKELLLQNGRWDDRDRDHAPVVKLFLPGTSCVWLLSEIDPEDLDIAFGLCDLGMGFPELGSVSLSELKSVCYLEGVPVQRDESFTAEFPMSVYAAAARSELAITEDYFALRSAAAALHPAQGAQPSPPKPA